MHFCRGPHARLRTVLPRQKQRRFAGSRRWLGSDLRKTCCGGSPGSSGSEEFEEWRGDLLDLPARAFPSTPNTQRSVFMTRRLLLIEDEPTLAMLLQERLEREGYSVATCHDGERGLAEALRGAYDLVVLDIRLPGRNGFEICRELRRHSI